MPIDGMRLSVYHTIVSSVCIQAFISFTDWHKSNFLSFVVTFPWIGTCTKIVCVSFSVENFVFGGNVENCIGMSSASLVEKRSLRKSQSRNIGTSSTSITSAPPTTSDSKKHDSHQRSKDNSMRSKQRDSLPDIGSRKGNRSVRASNFELSSSANGFESATNHDRQSAAKVTAKPRVIASNVAKPDIKHTDDKVLEMLKMDSIDQESYKWVVFEFAFVHIKNEKHFSNLSVIYSCIQFFGQKASWNRIYWAEKASGWIARAHWTRTKKSHIRIRWVDRQTTILQWDAKSSGIDIYATAILHCEEIGISIDWNLIFLSTQC